MSDLKQLLAEWHDPYDAHTLPDAEDLIDALEIELAGKEAVIKHLLHRIEFEQGG